MFFLFKLKFYYNKCRSLSLNYFLIIKLKNVRKLENKYTNGIIVILIFGGIKYATKLAQKDYEPKKIKVGLGKIHTFLQFCQYYIIYNVIGNYFSKFFCCCWLWAYHSEYIHTCSILPIRVH